MLFDVSTKVLFDVRCSTFNVFLIYLFANGFIILFLFSEFENELLFFLVKNFKFICFFFFMATPRKRNRKVVSFRILNKKKKGFNMQKNFSGFFIIKKKCFQNSSYMN